MKIPHFVLFSGGLLAGCLSAVAAEQTLSPASAATTAAAPAIPTGTPSTFGIIQAFIVQGDVQLIDKDGNAMPLTRGHSFTGEGSTVKVGANGQALLVFSNGATIKALANCTVKISLFRQAPFDEQAQGTFLRLSADPSRSNIILDLISGTFQGEVKKINKAAGSTFIVNTPQGSADIQGSMNLSIPSGATQFTPAKVVTSAPAP